MYPTSTKQQAALRGCRCPECALLAQSWDVPKPPPKPRETPRLRDLYRCRDAEGTLLYVGISLSLPHRLTGHRHTATWWPDVATVEVEHLGLVTRAEAEHIERTAIVTEHPHHNVAGRVIQAMHGARP